MGNFNTDLLREFNFHFKKGKSKSIINMDYSLSKPFEFQIQRFEDAVEIFGGSIPLTRFSHYYVAIVISGRGVKTIGLTEFKVIPNSIMFVPSGIINSSHSFTPDIKGFIVSFNADFLLLSCTNKKFLFDLPFFKTESRPYLYLNDTDCNSLLNIFQNIANEYLNNQKNKEELIRLYILELLIKCERIYNRQVINQIDSDKSTIRIVNEFKRLLENHFLEKKNVSFYAKQIAVHPNYLNATVKNITGKTCSRLIHDRIILEAKCLLQSTNMTIKEIASYLSFDDNSYFSKYFKKMTNVNPLDYRNGCNI